MCFAVALVAFVGACSSGATEVQFIDDKGKSAGSMTMTEPEVLDLRQGKVVYGSGYMVDCGSVRNPLRGESVLFSADEYGGYCNAVQGSLGANGLADVGETWAFSLDESWAAWSNGASMNNAIRSAKTMGWGALFAAGANKLHVVYQPNENFGGGPHEYDATWENVISRPFAIPCPSFWIPTCSASFSTSTSAFGHFVQQ